MHYLSACDRDLFKSCSCYIFFSIRNILQILWKVYLITSFKYSWKKFLVKKYKKQMCYKENISVMKKEEMIPSWGKKAEKNKATIKISVDGKGTGFPVKLKLRGAWFEKYIKKGKIKKI